MNNCITKVPLGQIYLYQGLDANCKPVWNYADNGSGSNAGGAGTALRKGDSVVGSDGLTHLIDDGFIGSILDVIDTASLDLSLTGNDLKGDVNPLWVKALLSVAPTTYINMAYNASTGVISASLNAPNLFTDYFANLQIGAFSYGSTPLVGVDGKKYVVPAQTLSYEASSKRVYISNGNFATLPLTAGELATELNNLPTTTDAVYGTSVVLGKDNAWHKLPAVSGGGGTDSQQLSIAGNVISLTNGGSVTLPSGGATTNDISSAVNILTSNVNGVSDTAPIINSNQIAVSQASVISTVNGVASTQAIGAGVAARIAAFDSSGVLIHAAVPSGGGGSGANANDISSAGNVMTSNVDGHVDTALIINSNTVALNSSSLTSTVNGIVGTQAIQTGTLADVLGFNSGGVLVKGTVASGATTNDISSAANVLTSNVNGVSDTATIINSNQININQNSGLVSNVNGISASQAIASGVAARMVAFDSTGAFIHAAVPSGGGGSGANTNDISSAGNVMTSNVDGHVDTAPIINTNSLTLTQANGLQSSVNGVVGTLPIPSGVLNKAIGYNIAGDVVYGNPASITSNSVQLASGFITTTVNGFGAAQPILTGTPVKILGFDSNDLPITVTPASLGGGGGVTTNDISSSGNTLTSNVNGVSDTANIINSLGASLNQTDGLKVIVNGLTANQPLGADVAVRMAGFNSSGTFIHAPIPSGGGTDSQTLSLAGNTLSISNGNSVTLPSAGATTNNLSMTNGGITSNVNGVASTVSTPTGGINEFLGFNFSGNPVRSTLPNTLTSTNNRITSTVNGTAANLDANIGTLQFVAGWNSSGNFTSQAASALGGGGTSYTFNDTNSIDLVTSGTTITGNVKRSAAANNSIVENGDGLYSPSTLSDLGNPSVIPQGGAAVMGATDVLGKDLQWRTLPSVSGGGGVTSNSLTSSGNMMTSNVNAFTSNANIVNSHTIGSIGGQLFSNVNGVFATTSLGSGTLTEALGFDSTGNLVKDTLVGNTPSQINRFGNFLDYPGSTADFQQFNTGVGTIIAPNGMQGSFNLNPPAIAGNAPYKYVVIPELVCNISGFQNIPVSQAFGECALDISTDNGATWNTWVSNSVQTNVRGAGSTPAGYSNTIYSHDKWKVNWVGTSSAASVVQINWRVRIQVYSGILASVYVWTPFFYVIGVPS